MNLRQVRLGERNIKVFMSFKAKSNEYFVLALWCDIFYIQGLQWSLYCGCYSGVVKNISSSHKDCGLDCGNPTSRKVESCIATSINYLTRSKIEDISTEMLSGNSKRVLNDFVGSKDVWKGNV